LWRLEHGFDRPRRPRIILGATSDGLAVHPGRCREGPIDLKGLALYGATLSTIGACADASETADLIFNGGTIYTVDEALPLAEAVAVRDGRILYVGSAEGAEAHIGDRTEIVDLAGRMLLPGFVDTHVHPLTGGMELGDCDLNPAQTRDDVVRIVSECARRSPEAPWVRGGGYQLPIFPDGAPDRRLLDSLVSDRPAYLTSADGHSAWVNTRALELGGVDASTPDPPPDGVILREPDGLPQGTLRESAMALVGRFVPEYTPAERVAGLERALAMAASFGITTVHEASAGEPALRTYDSLDRAGDLTARAIVALRVDPLRGAEQVAELAALRDRYGGRSSEGNLQPVAAKVFLDGVIEGGSAALLADYLDRPGWRGDLNLAPARLDSLVAALDSAGFKVHIHAIGDRAIRAGLDAFAAQRGRDGGAGPRHILAHIQLFDPADVPRFAETGAVASFQPLWAYADTYITDLTEPRLGPERSRWLYPIRSVVASGAIVAAGSDWSVSSMNPLLAIEVAVTRRDHEIDSGPSWIPEERVDVETMLRAYTLQGALASDLEIEIGTITVGKRADLVVLDRDLLTIRPEEISETRVDLTVFGGRVVYRRDPGP
jgi:predicted amidohydrolase YtcJ